MTPPPGYVSFGKSQAVYHAKERLKQLGAYWNPEGKCWFVPEDREDEARAQVAMALQVGAMLEPDPDLGPLPRSTRPSVRALACYVCGDRFTTEDMRDRGGDPEEYYCGCVEVKAARMLEARRRPVW